MIDVCGMDHGSWIMDDRIGSGVFLMDPGRSGGKTWTARIDVTLSEKCIITGAEVCVESTLLYKAFFRVKT